MKDESTSPATKRHWFQFSLRRLTVSITLFAVSFGAWAIFAAPFDERSGWHFGLLGILALLALGIGSFSAAVGVLFVRNWLVALAIGAIIGIGWMIWFIIGFAKVWNGLSL